MKTIKAKVQADNPVTESSLDKAIERGELRRKNSLQATAVTYQPPAWLSASKTAAAYCCPWPTIRSSMILRAGTSPV